MSETSRWTTVRVTKEQAETIKNLAREISLRDKTDVDASGVVRILLNVYRAARMRAEAEIGQT